MSAAIPVTYRLAGRPTLRVRQNSAGVGVSCPRLNSSPSPVAGSETFRIRVGVVSAGFVANGPHRGRPMVFDFLAVGDCPRGQGGDRVDERAPQRGQFLLERWWDVGEDGSSHEAVTLQTPQREREHSLRNPNDDPEVFTKPEGALCEDPDDEQRPLVTEKCKCVPDDPALCRLPELR